MINDDKTFYHKALVWSAFLFLVIKPLVTVYHRYAIFFRPISPSRIIYSFDVLQCELLKRYFKTYWYRL